MNMRSYNNKYSRAISYSYDGGESWSEIDHDYQLVESLCQASIFSYRNFVDRNLFLFPNPAVPAGRTHLALKMSFDDCQSWSNSKLLYLGPSGYSCLTRLSNGHIGMFFECGIKSPYEKMVFVSIDPGGLEKFGTLINEQFIIE